MAPLQHRPGELHPTQLDVGLHPFLAQPHGEDRHTGGLEGHQRLRHRSVGVVGTVAQEDEPGEWHPGKLLPGHVQRRAQVGMGSLEGQLLGPLEAGGVGGEPEEAQREAFPQLTEELARLGIEGFAYELAPGDAVLIGELHAPGVVHQNPQEVLLRHHGGEDEGRPEETEEEDGQKGHPKSRHGRPFARRGVCPGQGVGGHGDGAHDAGGEEPHPEGPWRTQGELALLEHQRPILEEELEERVHGSAGRVSGSCRRRSCSHPARRRRWSTPEGSRGPPPTPRRRPGRC